MSSTSPVPAVFQFCLHHFIPTVPFLFKPLSPWLWLQLPIQASHYTFPLLKPTGSRKTQIWPYHSLANKTNKQTNPPFEASFPTGGSVQFNDYFLNISNARSSSARQWKTFKSYWLDQSWESDAQVLGRDPPIKHLFSLIYMYSGTFFLIDKRKGKKMEHNNGPV